MNIYQPAGFSAAPQRHVSANLGLTYFYLFPSSNGNRTQYTVSVRGIPMAHLGSQNAVPKGGILVENEVRASYQV